MSDRKRAERERKRAEREAKARAGVPEPRQVDASIVAGVKAAIAIRTARKTKGFEIPVGSGFRTEWVMRAAMRDLCAKSLKGHPLDRRECATAIRGRLTRYEAEELPSGAPAPVQEPSRPSDEEEDFEAAIQDLIDLVDQEP